MRQRTPASVRTSLVTMWTRPPLIRCQIGPSVPSLCPVLHVVLWTPPPLICFPFWPSVPSLHCVTLGTLATAAPDLLSSWAKRPVPPAASRLLLVSRGSVAQVVGHAPQHSKNTPFSCSGVSSGDFYPMDPRSRQVIDTATSAGALGYLTALPPSSGLALSSASGVDATPSSLSLSHSASLSLLGGVDMSQSGVAGCPRSAGDPPPWPDISGWFSGFCWYSLLCSGPQGTSAPFSSTGSCGTQLLFLFHIASCRCRVRPLCRGCFCFPSHRWWTCICFA